jgi:signal transduction histidine kinase
MTLYAWDAGVLLRKAMSELVQTKPALPPSSVQLVRGAVRRQTNPGLRLAALRVPLAVKLGGANVLVVGLLAGGWIADGGDAHRAVVAILIAVALHSVLMLLALVPIRELENVASRVWSGDYAARVERSVVADSGALRVGSMFNALLDGLESDRARMRALTAEVIEAGDRERADVARELHDSAAQRIAALQFQLSRAARDASRTDADLAQRLNDARDDTQSILEEIRGISHAMHPAVLDDLGLEAALRALARDVSRANANATPVDIDIDASTVRVRLPTAIEKVFYRVAQEALRNAIAHGAPRGIRIRACRDAADAVLEIHDDGCGFDLAAANARRHGLGLLSMQERVSLLGGHVEIRTAPGSGTTVVASVPLDTDVAVANFSRQ